MKRRVFRTHYILSIGGRLFTVLLLMFPLFMLSLFVRDFHDLDIPTVIFSIVVILGIFFLDVWLSKYFWTQCWSKLILKSDCVVWNCIFCKSIKIPYDEIKYVSVRSFSQGNVIKKRDLYNTGFLYIIISAGEVPDARVDKIYSKPGLIKFNFSKKLGIALINRVPKKYSGVLKQYVKN